MIFSATAPRSVLVALMTRALPVSLPMTAFKNSRGKERDNIDQVNTHALPLTFILCHPSKTSLYLAHEQTPIQIVMCSSSHVTSQNSAMDVACDDCTAAASEGGDVCWTCDQCNYDISIIYAKKQWAYPKSCMQE